MSGKILTISKPKGKKGKTLRSPRPTMHHKTKEERNATMDEIEAFFKEHNIRENIRESPPPETPKNKKKGAKKGRRCWGMKTRKLRK